MAWLLLRASCAGVDDIALTRALEGRTLEEDEVHGWLEKLPLT